MGFFLKGAHRHPTTSSSIATCHLPYLGLLHLLIIILMMTLIEDLKDLMTQMLP